MVTSGGIRKRNSQCVVPLFICLFIYLIQALSVFMSGRKHMWPRRFSRLKKRKVSNYVGYQIANNKGEKVMFIKS